MIASTVKQPMEALDAAIKATDTAAYNKAYAELTASCNTCHQSANHPEIVIQVPTVSSFPDQDFQPQK
jgi:mono/diheme cytochrome c family protein